MSRRRRLIRYVIPSLALALLPGLAHPQGSACPSSGPAEQYGPTTTREDSAQVYSSLLSPDGNEFWFFKHVGPRNEDYRIFRSLRRGTRWGEAERVDLGESPSDLYPALSPDGRLLVFSSYRRVAGDTSRVANAHLWYAERTMTGWSAPQFIRHSALGHYHSGLRFDTTGIVRYGLTTPDWRSQSAFAMRWTGSSFETPTLLPEPDVVSFWRGRSADTMYVWGANELPGGVALLSVSRVTQPRNRRSPGQFFVSRRESTGWSPLAPAPGGLSRGSPNFVWVSADGCYLHWTQDYWTFMRMPLSSLDQASARPGGS
jgi:hypothetical protein